MCNLRFCLKGSLEARVVVSCLKGLLLMMMTIVKQV